MIVIGYLLAVLIGLSLGLLGGGGSILAVPVLVYVLGFGMKQAVPMSLAVVGITSFFGAVSHHRSGNIRWDAAAVFGPSAVVGAVAGARLAGLLSSRVQLIIFGVVMIVAAGSMFAGSARWQSVGEEKRVRRPWPVIGVLGAGVGMLTGLVGVGGGFLYVPALVLLGGLSMKEAVGTSLVLIILSCLAGLASYLGVVNLDWQATGLFGAPEDGFEIRHGKIDVLAVVANGLRVAIFSCSPR